MSRIERNFVMFNDNDTLEFAATNFDVSKKSVKKYEDYFKYYNKDGNKKLDENELTEIVNDLKEGDLDGSDSLSNKEINKVIKKITGKKGKVNKADRKEFFGFLNKIQKNYDKKIGSTSDGKIDDFHQGGTGDCWLLTQIKAMSGTDWGADAIKKAINFDEKSGNYTIKFDGVDFETVITQDDIKEAREKATSTRSFYTKGDLDVMLLEMGVERYMQQEVDKGNIVRGDPVMYANQSAGKLSFQYMLTGNPGRQYSFTESSDEKLKDTSRMSDVSKSNWKQAQDSAFITRGDKKEAVAGLLKKLKETDGACATFGKSGKPVGHAYMLKDVVMDKDGNITDVIFIDPNITHVTRHETLEEFIENLNGFDVITPNGDYSKFDEGFLPHPKRIED